MAERDRRLDEGDSVYRGHQGARFYGWEARADEIALAMWTDYVDHNEGAPLAGADMQALLAHMELTGASVLRGGRGEFNFMRKLAEGTVTDADLSDIDERDANFLRKIYRTLEALSNNSGETTGNLVYRINENKRRVAELLGRNPFDDEASKQRKAKGPVVVRTGHPGTEVGC